jgi:hypothetical protein
LRSILAAGLDPARHLCPRPEVWLHSPCRSAWAILHTAQRHLVPADQVAVVTVRVPRSWLTRRRRCVWSLTCLIEPSRIVSFNPRAAIAEAA